MLCSWTAYKFYPANICPLVLTWATDCLALPEPQAALLPDCLSAYGVTSICPGEK